MLAVVSRNARSHARPLQKLLGVLSGGESGRPFSGTSHESATTISPSSASTTAASTAATTTAATTTAATFSLLDDKVDGPYTVERKRVFAVVELAGTQYKVTPDDLIITEKLTGVDINDKIRLNKVLLLGSEHETVIGRPYVEDAFVTAAVEEQFLDGKVIVFKKRRRKNSRRTLGHRQPLTSLRILSVVGVDIPDELADVSN